MDAQEQHRQAGEDWDRVAAGWARRQDDMERTARPVSEWLVEALEPRPGQRLLDVATGTGAVALLAAERVVPGGEVLGVDASDGMVAAARDRTRSAGAPNVRFERMEAERLALPDGERDGVLCRWGYMLMPDPLAAVRETHRVLRPGGRLALAVWDLPERNPWAAVPHGELVRRGLAERPGPDTPGMFALANPARLEALLARAGFRDGAVEAMDVEFRHESVGEWWDFTLDVSQSFTSAIASLDDREREELRAAVGSTLAPWTAGDGSLALPGRVLVAVATA